MSNAISDGWLIPLLAALISAALVPFGRWLANQWRKPLEEEKALRRAMEAKVGELQEAVQGHLRRETEERVKRMLAEARLEYCEKELENWRTGKWDR